MPVTGRGLGRAAALPARTPGEGRPEFPPDEQAASRTTTRIEQRRARRARPGFQPFVEARNLNLAPRLDAGAPYEQGQNARFGMNVACSYPGWDGPFGWFWLGSLCFPWERPMRSHAAPRRGWAIVATLVAFAVAPVRPASGNAALDPGSSILVRGFR